MNNDLVKGMFFGAGALLGVLVVGLFVFNYFNNQVATVENTISVITVSSLDGTQDLGMVYVDSGTLKSTVTDADFKAYYDANKTQLAEATYTYTAQVLDEATNTYKDQEVSTTRLDEDFAYGLIVKISSDMKGKYLFNVDELVVQ